MNDARPLVKEGTMPDDLDPYRCPTCDRSVMRGYAGGKGRTMFACEKHGIVEPRYDQERMYKAASASFAADKCGCYGDSGPYTVYCDHHDPENRLLRLRGLLSDVLEGRRASEASSYLAELAAEDNQEALEEHCSSASSRTDQNKWAVGDVAICPVCGARWLRFEGVWFLSGRIESLVKGGS